MAETSWTDKYGVSERVRGLDHLGLESAAENLYDLVTPGFTNLAKRARYYALYCWILQDYFEGGHQEGEEFAPFFRRREHAYALACLSHDHPPGSPGASGIMGSINATQHWSSGTDPIDLSQSHMKSQLGGFGLYYRNAMQRAGLIQTDSRPEKLTEAGPEQPSGRALAEAYRRVIEDTEYYRHYRDSREVPREVLKEYGEAACVCIMANDPDGEELRKALLQPDPPESDPAARAVHRSRSETLALIFDAIEESHGERLHDRAWRNLMFYGQFADGRPSNAPDSTSVAETVWRVYQQRELHVYALTALWQELLSWLEGRRDARLEEWVEELDSLADLSRSGTYFGLQLESGKPSEVTVGAMLDAIAEASKAAATFAPELSERIENLVSRQGSCSESSIVEALERRKIDSTGERIGAALWLSLVLYARTRNWLERDPEEASLLQTGDARRWSVTSFFAEVDRRRETSVLEILAWIYQGLVRQHLTVAMSKLPLDTFKVLYDDGALTFRAHDEAQFTADRYETILVICRDLGWVYVDDAQAYRLTPTGQTARSDALQVLS